MIFFVSSLLVSRSHETFVEENRRFWRGPIVESAKSTKKQPRNFHKVKYIWYFIRYDLWDRAGKGDSSSDNE